MRLLGGLCALAACGGGSAPETPVANTAVAPPSLACDTVAPLTISTEGDCAGETRNSDGTPRQLPPPPPSEPGRWIVLGYDDFGPQVVAFGLIGMGWWSWEGGGSYQPCDAFDVRVVVHAPELADEAARRYPTVVGESDYRLVPHDEALRYLDDELASMVGEDDLPSLRRTLEDTRARIDACLARR